MTTPRPFTFPHHDEVLIDGHSFFVRTHRSPTAGPHPAAPLVLASAADVQASPREGHPNLGGVS